MSLLSLPIANNFAHFCQLTLSSSHRKLHYANSPAVTNKKKKGLLIDLLAEDLLLPQEVMNINSRVS